MMHYEIHDNLFSGAREDGLQLIDYADDSDRTFDIYRNIFVDNTDVGIGTMAADTAENFQGAAMTERVRIYNNYFYNNSYHITGGDNMIVLNNIFEGASNTAVHRIKTDSIVDYNLFYNNGTNISDTLTGSHNLFTNPQRNSDFTLQAGSPAIDAGTASYTHNSETVLQLSSSEYVGQAPDMGRYEYGSTGSAPIITLLGDNPLYPPSVIPVQRHRTVKTAILPHRYREHISSRQLQRQLQRHRFGRQQRHSRTKRGGTRRQCADLHP